MISFSKKNHSIISPLAVFLLLGVVIFGICPAIANAQESADPAVAASEVSFDSSEVVDSAKFWGMKVRKINYIIPSYMNKSEVKNATKIKVGKGLSRWRVRMTIRRIYLIGDIQQPVIKATPLPNGEVDVEIKVYPKYLIRDIEVKGNKHFNHFDIISDILRISTGDDFHENLVPIWKSKILAAYEKVGFLNARVKIDSPSTKWKEDNKTDLFIRVYEGKIFKVDTISLKGNLGRFSRSDILDKLGWRTGMSYNEEKLTKGIVKLGKFLKKEYYLEARISEWDINDRRIAKVDDENKTVNVILSIFVGPRVFIDLNKECFSCAQRKWKLPASLGIDNQRRFNKSIVKDWESRIALFFKSMGYFDAIVIGTYKETEDKFGPIKQISFTAEIGKKVKIRKIDFKNNPTYKDNVLLKLLTTGTYFTQSGFDTDLDNIINFYNRNGFLGAKILEKRLEYIPKDGLYIVVVLQEGSRTILTKINIPDTKVYHQKDFNKFIAEINANIKEKDPKFKEGDPFNPFILEDIRSKFIAEYMRQGYIESRVKAYIKTSNDGKSTTVTFDITEGRRYKFGNIYIHGNKLTKDHVIRRELFITTGRPFNYERVFESEQSLVQLGFFKSVQIRPIDIDEESEQVDLLVEVEERNSGYIETGLGYNTYFGYSVAFEVGHKNLAGHGRRLSFHTDASMSDERFIFDTRHMAVDFMWPWVARTPMDGKLTFFDNVDQDIGFNLRSFGTVVGVSTNLTKLFFNLKATRANEKLQKLWKYWTVGLEYEFAKDFIYNLDSDVDADPGEIQITILKPSVTRDEVNNPFNPTRGIKAQLGSRLTGSLSWAAPALQSQVHYLQASVQGSAYYGLFTIPKTGVMVFAQNFRFGHGQVLRETDIIPISRRFYLGGSTTLRGFSSNQIAPLGTDNRTPTGGNFLAQSNTELRIPLPKNLGVLLFFDAGDVSRDLEHFYLDLLRTSTGLGFRYMTPIGPISLDYGIKLNKRHYETPGEFYITIGNAF